MRIPGVAAICALSWLAGCHSDTAPPPGVTPTVHAAKPAAVKQGPTPEELTVGMVEAVAQGKSPLHTLVKFDLTERPVAGQELDVSIALIPKIAAAPASMAFSVVSDLDLVPGYEHIEIPSVDSAGVYRNMVRVVPRQEGVALLAIQVTLKHDDQVDVQTFSVPLVIAPK